MRVTRLTERETIQTERENNPRNDERGSIPGIEEDRDEDDSQSAQEQSWLGARESKTGLNQLHVLMEWEGRKRKEADEESLK